MCWLWTEQNTRGVQIDCTLVVLPAQVFVLQADASVWFCALQAGHDHKYLFQFQLLAFNRLHHVYFVLSSEHPTKNNNNHKGPEILT